VVQEISVLAGVDECEACSKSTRVTVRPAPNAWGKAGARGRVGACCAFMSELCNLIVDGRRIRRDENIGHAIAITHVPDVRHEVPEALARSQRHAVPSMAEQRHACRFPIGPYRFLQLRPYGCGQDPGEALSLHESPRRT
jgi:hypothetical protein